jgi:uncharacterized protein (DUF58 family)
MPTWDEAAVAAAAKRLRLGLDPRRRRQGAGTRLGSGPGASLEFHDHRSYMPGDDLRHLDWGVFARSDQLVLRRHRVEVSPVLEVLIDCSLSMDAHPRKFAHAAALAALLGTLAEMDGSRPRLWSMGNGTRRLGAAGGSQAWRNELRGLTAQGSAGASAKPPPLQAGSDRILISDGLAPEGGAAVVRQLGGGAGRICLLQVLTREERAPTPLGAVRLEDVEGGALDLVHDESVCTAYRERLARHQAGWQAALSGRGAGLVSCHVEDGIEGSVAALVKAGVVEARTP